MISQGVGPLWLCSLSVHQVIVSLDGEFVVGDIPVVVSGDVIVGEDVVHADSPFMVLIVARRAFNAVRPLSVIRCPMVSPVSGSRTHLIIPLRIRARHV